MLLLLRILLYKINDFSCLYFVSGNFRVFTSSYFMVPCGPCAYFTKFFKMLLLLQTLLFWMLMVGYSYTLLVAPSRCSAIFIPRSHVGPCMVCFMTLWKKMLLILQILLCKCWWFVTITTQLMVGKLFFQGSKCVIWTYFAKFYWMMSRPCSWCYRVMLQRWRYRVVGLP